MVPEWKERFVQQLMDWKQCPVLNVESSRLAIWHKLGLLLIGDGQRIEP